MHLFNNLRDTHTHRVQKIITFAFMRKYAIYLVARVAFVCSADISMYWYILNIYSMTDIGYTKKVSMTTLLVIPLAKCVRSANDTMTKTPSGTRFNETATRLYEIWWANSNYVIRSKLNGNRQNKIIFKFVPSAVLAEGLVMLHVMASTGIVMTKSKSSMYTGTVINIFSWVWDWSNDYIHVNHVKSRSLEPILFFIQIDSNIRT